jgi:NhaP-type Na+/H+ or K+/H+ antiporter
MFILAGTAVVGPIVYPGLTVIQYMILGTILGGLSTVAVASIRDQIGREDYQRAWRIMTLESTIVDPIRVVVAISLIQVAFHGNIQPMETVKDIFFILLAGSTLGLVLGILWSAVLHRLRLTENQYMITLAILLQVYYLAEYVAGSGGGTIACFIFGFAISNLKMLSRWLGYVPRIDVRRLNEVNKELSFVLKSYYFVYTGMIVQISTGYLAAGIAFTAMIILLRMISGSIVGYNSEFKQSETWLLRLTYPLGTSALVFATLPLVYDPEGLVFTDPHLYTNLVFPVVLGTIVFSSLIGPIILRTIKKTDSET